MSQLTLGVIGHVDHGKTSVVRMLTGTDTDRLPEEKARGMSIVPGYAWLDVPGGNVDVIDVPGHEDFLRGMIAGAAGIDAALLVVDAREGPRAQTVEHIEVAAALGVQAGIVALNKVDLLAPPERVRARQAVRDALRRSFLADAPIVETSAVTGHGLDALRHAIAALLHASSANAAPAGPFFVGVDRAFTLAGQGTIVTGTLRGGPLERGCAVDVLPAGLASHVRQLHVHGRSVERAWPGQRVGINLRGVKVEEVGRGCVLAAPGEREASSAFRARLRLLDGRAIRPGETLRLFVGTDSVPVRVRGGGVGSLQGPAEARVEMRAQRALCAAAGERFLLRSDALHRTVACGELLAIGARRLALDDASLEGLQSQLLHALDEFHASHPAREGASIGWWRTLVPERHRGRAADEAIARLLAAKRIERVRDLVRRAGFDPMRDLPGPQRDCAAQLERCFREAGATPPDVAQVVGGDAARESVCRLLVARGRLVRVGGHGAAPVLFHRDVLDEARRRIAQAFPPPAAFTVGQAREILGSTRKYVVPLLEFLDASRFTLRRGDLRSVAGNPAADAQSQARR